MSVQVQIEEKLKSLSPSYVSVENESHNHSVPPNSETHFKVVIVSKDFEGQRSVKRHQAIYAVLADELVGPVHALALHTYTEEEWRGQSPASPNCLGGGSAG